MPPTQRKMLRTFRTLCSHGRLVLHRQERLKGFDECENCKYVQLLTELFFTWFSSREIVGDVVHGVADVVVSGHVHVDEAEEGRGLHPQHLRPFRPGVQAPGEDVKPHGVQVLGQLVSDARVAAGDQDGLGAHRVDGAAQQLAQQERDDGRRHRANDQ